MKSFVQRHPMGRWQSQNLKPGVCECRALTHHPILPLTGWAGKGNIEKMAFELVLWTIPSRILIDGDVWRWKFRETIPDWGHHRKKGAIRRWFIIRICGDTSGKLVSDKVFSIMSLRLPANYIQLVVVNHSLKHESTASDLVISNNFKAVDEAYRSIIFIKDNSLSHEVKLTKDSIR